LENENFKLFLAGDGTVPVLHTHNSMFEQRYEEPSVLILKNTLDIYDSNVSSQIHIGKFAM